MRRKVIGNEHSFMTQLLMPKSSRSAEYRFKRPLDLIIVIVGHLVLAPIMIPMWVIIALAIWFEDRGSVFFSQDRIGKNGGVITVLKFRTMIPDADKKGLAWTVENDLRLTRTGRFIRKSRLDELPQVLSILKGDLSFVGPRPLPIAEQRLLETKILGFERRLKVRPGLTSLAKVYNSDDGAEAKLQFDLEYIRSMSLVLDLKLIFLSVWMMMRGRSDRRSGKSRM